MKSILIFAFALSACATYGEPSDLILEGGSHWYRDMPNFHLKSVEWVHITGPDALQRVANLAPNERSPYSDTRVIRIVETGKCIVYSTHSRAESFWMLDGSGSTLDRHEIGEHCGRDIAGGGGWTHREVVVIR
jgi:hypothetical protein